MIIVHPYSLSPDEMSSSETSWLYDRRYILTVAHYSKKGVSWGLVRTPEGEIVASIQGKAERFCSIEIGKDSVILGNEPYLIDLGKRTFRIIPETCFSWHHVSMSPDELTLLVAGEDLSMGDPLYQFFDLTQNKIEPIPSPHLSYFIVREDEREVPDEISFGMTKINWHDSCLSWITLLPEKQKREWRIHSEDILVRDGQSMKLNSKSL